MEIRKGRDRVCSVVVTYGFEVDALTKLIDALSLQTAFTYVIDNNHYEIRQGPDPKGVSSTSFRVVRNNENVGLAKALNQGLRLAMADGYTHILLMDQDSFPAPNMVERLMAAWENLSVQHKKIAALGPCIIDEHRKEALPFIQYYKTRIKKLVPDTSSPTPMEVGFLISSGCLLTADAVKAIGPMDPVLFIDYIDLEWCFRSKCLRYKLFGVPEAVLYHRMGDGSFRLPIIDKPVAINRPERQYYRMRNRMLLYRKKYVPVYWKIQDIPKLLFQFFFFTLFISPKRVNAKMMLRGFRDGLGARGRG